MSDSSDHPDALATLYLSGRDVPCPGCGYNRRTGTSARCPECGHVLLFVPCIPKHVFVRPAAITTFASSLLAGSLCSLLYFGGYGLQRFGTSLFNPFASLIEFSFAMLALISIVTVALCAVHLWRWRLHRRSLRRPTALLAATAILYHLGWACFLILMLINNL